MGRRGRRARGRLDGGGVVELIQARAGVERHADQLGSGGSGGVAGGRVELIETVAGLASWADRARARGERVGLVPTMGALHAGHRSLIERAAAECDAVVVTVFVNPLQFDDGADLAAYPRTLASDLTIAEAAGAGAVFAPPVAEMYPGHPAPPVATVTVGGPARELEGACRPGHFDGVATVVAKLFTAAGRCRAYFGEKDYQQLLIVRCLALDLCMAVEVVGCPTVREPDGLALSSRNVRLTPEHRSKATVLHRALREGASAMAAGERRPEAVRQAMVDVLASEPTVSVDYVAVVDPETLVVPEILNGAARLLVAARLGDVRLIDNLGATVGAASPPGARAGAGGPPGALAGVAHAPHEPVPVLAGQGA